MGKIRRENSFNPSNYSYVTAYTDLDGDTELPLGPEFQEHVNYFIQRKKRQPDYFLSTCLFRQLGSVVLLYAC